MAKEEKPAPTPAPPAPTTAPPTAAPEGGTPRTFTQEDVDRMIAAEKAQVERKTKKDVEQEVATRLGVSLADAEAIVKAAKDNEEALLTEAQRTAAAAQTDRDAAAVDRAEAARERFSARLERLLTAAGAPEGAAESINVAGVTPESTEEEVAAAIEETKKKFPALFTVVPKPVVDADPFRRGTVATAPTGGFGSAGVAAFERTRPKVKP